MNLELKEFQRDAVARLFEDVASAKYEIDRTGRTRPQALLLSAPTASGKTVMVASLIEKILGGDGGLPDEIQFEPEPDAVFLWLSDQPELNRQSRARLLSASNRLRAHDLLLIGNDFDAESFDGGKVFFLNSQKVGRDKLLTRRSDRRHWTIWETIANTQTRLPSKFYVIIDEAHRGMNVPTNEREQANSIVQKFIIGSPEDGLPLMNLVFGLSATPERFQGFLRGTGRTVRSCDIDPADVRQSGLIKDRIVLHPQAAQPSPWTLLAEACSRYGDMVDAWAAHASANGTELIRPAMIVQIEDGIGNAVSRTPLGPLLETLGENIPDLRPEQVVHCLQAEAALTVGEWHIRHAEPSTIARNETIRVVLFKLALTTGWDCPRAEVMVSFRAAQDTTAIAQLVGRMVRTPLATRAHGNELLNEVYLFLPRYDEAAVNTIVERLTADRESVPSADITTASRAASFSMREEFQPLLEHMRSLPSYTLTARRRATSLRRAVKLGRYLMQDRIAPEAQDELITGLVRAMNSHLSARLESDNAFDERLRSLETITYSSLILHAGEVRVERGAPRTVQVTARDVATLFSKAKGALTDEVAMAFWRQRFSEDDPFRAKIEAYELALDESLIRALEHEADRWLHDLFQQYRPAIARLGPDRRAAYNALHAVARHEEAGFLDIPQVITADVPPDAAALPGHMFVDDNGEFRAKLNGWEVPVLAEERAHPDFLTWLRNFDRKSWALAFPYTYLGQRRPGYPDFIVIRGTVEEPVFDLLEPHRGEDSVAKAKGLAEFADQHGASFGRIELIRLEGENIRRLDLNDHRIRTAVLPIESQDELIRLFDRQN
ncbi:DEAD/DEAH box helicase [Blastomonas sp.]|uniref:DEAD/DEAH box helicase n=1 Tax=Blastomonas sp. TaxID=1909299 RepID=UPI003593DEC5